MLVVVVFPLVLSFSLYTSPATFHIIGLLKRLNIAARQSVYNNMEIYKNLLFKNSKICYQYILKVFNPYTSR